MITRHGMVTARPPRREGQPALIPRFAIARIERAHAARGISQRTIDRREQDHHEHAQALHRDDERRVRAGAERDREHRVEAAGRRREVGVEQRRRRRERRAATARPKQATSSPRMHISTGTSRRPTSRTVATVKRSPMRRPISANAVSRRSGGTVKPSPIDASVTIARQDHRAEQRRRRQADAARRPTAPATASAAVSSPVAAGGRAPARAGGGRRAAGVVAGERRRRRAAA